MEKTKRRLETFSFYDRTGLEAHLARMAEKGWLLEKIGSFFWTYRKIEPKTLTFSVTYFPEASQFDPGPSEEQEAFYDLCAHSGWQLAAASAQLQVFYTEQKNPVPIDTDPVLEVESIHRTMKKSLIPSHLAMLALAVFQVVMFAWRAAEAPIENLANPAVPLIALCWALVVALAGVELSSYFRWHKKAALAAEHGEFLPTRSHRKLQLGALVLLGLSVACYILSVAVSGSRMVFALTVVLFLVYIPGLFLVLWGVSGWLKRRRASAKTNQAVTLIALAVAAFALLGVITFGAIFGHDRGWWQADRGTDRPPLRVEDLLDPGYDGYEVSCSAEQSVLLGRIFVNQEPPISLIQEDYARYKEIPTMEYTVVLVKLPALYDLCKNALLHDSDHLYEDLPAEERRCYAPDDPAPWGAREAYRWTASDREFSIYLLCYPDRIVEINFDHDWKVTPEQMALVAERLGRGELP